MALAGWASNRRAFQVEFGLERVPLASIASPAAELGSSFIAATGFSSLRGAAQRFACKRGDKFSKKLLAKNLPSVS